MPVAMKGNSIIFFIDLKEWGWKTCEMECQYMPYRVNYVTVYTSMLG